MSNTVLYTPSITEQLDLFHKNYIQTLQSANPLLNSIVKFTSENKGKGIRPILLFLSAKLTGTIQMSTYYSALSIELLHQASLFHDDVVDNSPLRRGRKSLNYLFDNKIAVLTGDFFLSTALINAVKTNNISILKEISYLGATLAEGELHQIEASKHVNLDEEEYLKILAKKTASLLSVSMKIGAISSAASKEEIELLSEIGFYLGMCFQLRDDVFDYVLDNESGKPVAKDLKEKNISLPLIYSFNQFLNNDYLRIIEEEDFTDENIKILFDFVSRSGGIEYTYSKIEEYKQKSIEKIKSFPDSEARKDLLSVVDYIVNRSK
jgi:octaprenyl-diphosphate synthase